MTREALAHERMEASRRRAREEGTLQPRGGRCGAHDSNPELTIRNGSSRRASRRAKTKEASQIERTP
jgi:hypothetical protein